MADQVKLSPEMLLIKEVVSTQKELAMGNPSSWVLFSNDMTHTHADIKYVCHARMNYQSSGLYDQLVTAAPFTGNPFNLRYYQWLIEGPFQAFSDKITLEVFPDTKDYYLRCTDLDKWPANILYNFCIASRFPIEFKDVISRWSLFLEAGVDPSVGFLSAAFSGDKKICKDPWNFNPGDPSFEGNSNHFWFDMTASWPKFVSGEFHQDAVSKETFKEKPSASRPCNGIWGHTPGPQQLKLLKQSVREICAELGLPVEPKVIKPPAYKVKFNKFPPNILHEPQPDPAPPLNAQPLGFAQWQQQQAQANADLDQALAGAGVGQAWWDNLPIHPNPAAEIPLPDAWPNFEIPGFEPVDDEDEHDNFIEEDDDEEFGN